MHAATSKTTPVDADEMALVDSAASFGLKKLTWANLKATLKTYFDTLYLSSTLARRESLTANRTYYVRTDGNDSNTGLTNTSGGAFLTIQKALNVVLGKLDLSGFNVTAQVAAGAYTSAIGFASPQVGAGNITILGEDVLRAQFPDGMPDDKKPPRLVPKRIIVDRLQSAGLLEAARAAIDAADLHTRERWNTRTDIFANDPTALQMCEVIGADPAVIFAP